MGTATWPGPSAAAIGFAGCVRCVEVFPLAGANVLAAASSRHTSAAIRRGHRDNRRRTGLSRRAMLPNLGTDPPVRGRDRLPVDGGGMSDLTNPPTEVEIP